MSGVAGRSGRHKIDDPRREKLCIRLSKAERAAINEYAKENNLSVAQTLVNGFYSLLEKSNTKE